MTKTIVYASLISGIAALMILYGTANAIPQGDLDFVWDPAETSSDPIIAISGSFDRVLEPGEKTFDVKGELSVELEEEAENISEKIVITTLGDTTSTFTVKAHSHEGEGLGGLIFIDGQEFTVEFKTSDGVVTMLDVVDEAVSVSPPRTIITTQQKIIIPGSIVMCNDDETTCFEGFGVIRRESIITSDTKFGFTVSISTDRLDAELIGDTGFFKLELSRFFQQTVT